MKKSLYVGIVVVGVSILAVSCFFSSGDTDGKESVVSSLSEDENKPLGSMNPEALSEEELEAESDALNHAMDENPDDPRVRAWLKRWTAFNQKKAGLLYEITKKNGGKVQFYEPKPGVTLLSETGRGNDKSVLKEKKIKPSSLEDVFRALRPNKQTPKVLLEADERSRNIPKTQMSVELSDGPENHEPASEDSEDDFVLKAQNCSWFQTYHCISGGAQGWCQCNRTGNKSKAYEKMTHSDSAIYLAQGNMIDWHVKVGGNEWSWSVEYNHWRSAIRTTSLSCGCDGWTDPYCELCKRTHKIWTTGVGSNEIYHWSSCMDNEPVGNDCN